MCALLDGNNFYVSCERVFRPGLDGRPAVVLSNDDGSAIARLRERALRLRARILQWIGIPCGIGIAPTRTLAKHDALGTTCPWHGPRGG